MMKKKIESNNQHFSLHPPLKHSTITVQMSRKIFTKTYTHNQNEIDDELPKVSSLSLFLHTIRTLFSVETFGAYDDDEMYACWEEGQRKEIF